MRRKKDDKRVLRSGNGQQKKSRRIRRRNKNNTRNYAPNRQPINNRRSRPKRKANKALVFLMIFALVAFVVGAGIGISLGLDDGSNDGPHYLNVTKEMTSNLNDTDPVTFDKDVDGVDFNENESLMIDYTSYE